MAVYSKRGNNSSYLGENGDRATYAHSGEVKKQTQVTFREQLSPFFKGIHTIMYTLLFSDHTIYKDCVSVWIHHWVGKCDCACG
jgi:hypothetical protein